MVDRYLLVTLRTPEKVPEAYQAKTETGRQPLSLSVVLDVPVKSWKMPLNGSLGGRTSEPCY